MSSKTRVAPNVYRWPNGRFSVRIWEKGRRTERMLKAGSLRDACREAMAALDNPAHAPFRELARLYVEAGCWKAALREARSKTFIAAEKRNLAWLEKFYGDFKPETILPHTLLAYRDWRVKRVLRRTFTGLRAVDLELVTLSNVLNWGVFNKRVTVNHVATRRPIFASPSRARNANQCCPRSAEELHRLAARLFDSPDSEVLGWQLLIEALTGLRTNEALKLRRQADHGEPGHCAGDTLHVHRSKRGLNPRIHIEAPLADCLRAHRLWLERKHLQSPWWFPSPFNAQSIVHKNSLAHALARIAPAIVGKSRDITSHGMRAFFVAWRRSEGDDDSTIAAKLGLRSGGAQLIWAVYGTPESWAWGKVSATPETFPASWTRLAPELSTSVLPIPKAKS